MDETDLSEIRIDPSKHAPGSGDDGLRSTMTEGEEITEVNDKEDQKMPQMLTDEESLESTRVPKYKNFYPSWYRQIMREIKEPIEKQSPPKQPKIPKVPDRLLNDNTKECYSPLAVSIGPYHYPDRKGKLNEVEKLKGPMTLQFVENFRATSSFFERLEKVAREARTFYDEILTEAFTDEEFIKMMFIDGCFILQFMHCVKNGYKKLEMTDQQVSWVKRDLLLLENQLPLAVLKSLISHIDYRLKKRLGMEIIDYFISLHICQPSHQMPRWLWISLVTIGIVLIVAMFPLVLLFLFCCRCGATLADCMDAFEKPKFRIYDREPEHLLALLYSKFMCSQSGKVLGKTKALPQGSSGHYLHYSAKNLKKVGIHFNASRTGALTDVEFKSSIFYGKLKLPPIAIEESTKSLLLNLVAYETSASLAQLWVTSYICFMDSLINEAEDVQELRTKGILVNYLGADQQVADLFNEMGSYLKADVSTFNNIKRKINKQCERSISKWVAEWQQTYFGSPWTVIAVLAAAFGLALTATQTYYTRFPPR